MKILSIETSGPICSVSLSIDEKLIAEYSVYRSYEHDRLLATLTDNMLKHFDLQISDIDAVAISAGPGSFTGLRIGAAFALSLCFGGNPKLIAVPTLSAIANYATEYIEQKDNICCAIASHKNFVYFQKFDKNGNPISEIIFDELNNLKHLFTNNSFLCGNGFSLLNKKSFLSSGITAKVIDKLAVNLFKANSFINSEEFVPLYVQDFKPKNYEKIV